MKIMDIEWDIELLASALDSEAEVVKVILREARAIHWFGLALLGSRLKMVPDNTDFLLHDSLNGGYYRLRVIDREGFLDTRAAGSRGMKRDLDRDLEARRRSESAGFIILDGKIMVDGFYRAEVWQVEHRWVADMKKFERMPATGRGNWKKLVPYVND